MGGKEAVRVTFEKAFEKVQNQQQLSTISATLVQRPSGSP
jgi:hypothetical protein